VGVKEVRWYRYRYDTEQASEYTYTFFYGNGNENHELGTSFIVHKRIIFAVKRAAFVSDRMPNIILRDRWWHIIVLKVHSPTEHKVDDVKVNVYEELVLAFDKLLKYYIQFNKEISLLK
jgi:hypothetical protein